MFQLTRDEYDALRSQIATSNKGGRRYMPYVFTEHGVLQASNVIKSDLADRVSVFVIRVFVEMRAILITQKEIIDKKKEIELIDAESDLKIDKFFLDIKPKLYGAINNILDSVIDKTT